MDSEPELIRFYNCTEKILVLLNPNNEYNTTHLLETLPMTLKNDIVLKEALGDCLYPGAKRPYQPPLWAQITWSLVFIAMILIAVIGNIVVIWIVLAHRRMRTVTNCFLVNLAIADLLMATLNGVPNFIFLVTAHWPFGTIYCTASNFTANTTVAASIFTLVAISVDRYVAIVRPLHHRLSGRVARCSLICVWTCSGLLALPCILYSATLTKKYANGESRDVCFMQWPDGRYPFSTSEYIYNLVFLAVTYIAPVIVMIWAYARMGQALWGTAIGEITIRQMQSVRAKRKIVRMFILVVGLFTLCWLPYHAYFILVYHHTALTTTEAAQHIYLAFYWLAMSNAMFNPLIYYWMNNKFRLYFQQALCLRNGDTSGLPNSIQQLDMQRSYSASNKQYRNASYTSGV